MILRTTSVLVGLLGNIVVGATSFAQDVQQELIGGLNSALSKYFLSFAITASTMSLYSKPLLNEAAYV
jgi:hypothetical protein